MENSYLLLNNPSHDPSKCSVCSPKPRAEDSYEVLLKIFPQLARSSAPCPAYGEVVEREYISGHIELNPCRWGRSEVGTMILHLNDAHKWSREKIADWIDTLDVDLQFPVTIDADEV